MSERTRGEWCPVEANLKPGSPQAEHYVFLRAFEHSGNVVLAHEAVKAYRAAVRDLWPSAVVG